ncbi:MAG: tRNA (adenosine(37)-N6)-threonylcarbamoyltransferase complex ATPase subunit type 1 TsaE [Gammaproteobacteria bacterium]|nr:tRNA (adenosine(37)-N6)-threonylcarbamoyltransferase complex ATPase subunit type 1 TsaE [Gammaproteobacteria bacterium]
MNVEQKVASDSDMVKLGEKLSNAINTVQIVFLKGDLGAGKTTLVRGILRGLGYHDSVKSPTFSLHEQYVFGGLTVHHFDLYRLQEPEELEYLGFRDLLRPGNVFLIEWPERAQAILPDPDIEIIITKETTGRRVNFIANPKTGHALVDSLQ